MTTSRKSHTSVNFPPVEVHFVRYIGTEGFGAIDSSKGFPNVKAARRWLRANDLTIKNAKVTVRTEPLPFSPTTIISFDSTLYLRRF